MNRLGKLFVAVALAFAGAACKDDVRKDADRAAENLQDQKEDLVEESKELKEAVQEQAEDQRELAESQRDVATEDRVAGLPERGTARLNESEVKHNAKQLADESEDVADEAKEVQSASLDFEQRRAERFNQLKTIHSIIAQEPQMISVYAGITPLTDRARADVSEKMQVFQMRLDEAGNAVEALPQTDSADFEARNDAAAKAMENLDDARDDAWEALNDADLIEPS